jgi:hypothetical protein
MGSVEAKAMTHLKIILGIVALTMLILGLEHLRSVGTGNAYMKNLESCMADGKHRYECVILLR